MNALFPSMKPGPSRKDTKAIPGAGEESVVIPDGSYIPLSKNKPCLGTIQYVN
jgi:hypothetical protein